MFSANVSLQHIFADDYNTRYPDLVDVSNPGDTSKTSGGAGVKAFATPAHERLAYGLLGGTIIGIVLAFIILPLMFQPDKVPDLDDWSFGHTPGDSKSKLLGKNFQDKPW